MEGVGETEMDTGRVKKVGRGWKGKRRQMTACIETGKGFYIVSTSLKMRTQKLYFKSRDQGCPPLMDSNHTFF